MEPTSEAGTPHHSFSRSFAFHCDNWDLREGSLPTLQDVAASETLFSVGNGFIGVRGFAEESETLMNGSYYRNNDASDNTNNNNGHNHRLTSNSMGSTGRRMSREGIAMARSSSMGSTGASSAFGRPRSQAGSTAGSPAGETYSTGSTSPAISSHVQRGCYIAGFCENYLLQNRTRAFMVGQCSKQSVLVPVPNPFSIDVFLGGEHVSQVTGRVVSHTRRLDLRTGELRRRFIWESHAQSGREVTIESTRFVSARRKNIAAVRFSVSAKNVSNTDIRILSRTEVPDDAASRSACGVENVFTRYNLQEAVSVVQVRTRNSCKHLTVATMETCTSSKQHERQMQQFAGASVASIGSSASNNTSFATSPTTSGQAGGNSNNHGLVFPGDSSASSTISASTSLAPKCSESENGTETFFTSIISEKLTIQLTKVIGYFTDEDAVQEDLGELAMQRTREAAQLGYNALYQESRTEMSKFWGTADIRYKGSRSVQGAFRYNMLQLSMSCGLSSHYGFPTRGLTGFKMGGVHQWDVDTFIIPTLTHTCPEKARALLRFRINTLCQAKNIASDLDLPRGAVYPFHTITGTENPPPYCSAFLFVNAVVANAMRQYVIATDDYSILAEGGAEVALSTALVWLEWGTWERGNFHIRSVSGPDMYAGDLDDNFFTNVMAQQHMQWMVQVGAYFRETWLVRWKEILEHSLATEEDIAELDRAASKMVLPFNSEHRIHPVDSSFMNKKQWTLENLNETRREALLHRYHPAVLYRHRICRIPDVLLAMILQPERFTQDEFRTHFIFYTAITSDDSALRHAINSVIAAQLRIKDKAMAHFRGALFVDLDNVIGNTDGGMHLTTAAGAWWALAMGFGGMKVVQGALHFNPILPDDCEEFQFCARHRGCLIRVIVTERMVTYTLESSTKNTDDLLLIHADINRIHLRKGIPETVRLFREVRVFDFDCVIFEMDSIIIDIEEFHYDAWKETLEGYFHEHDFPDFAMSKELYLAYLRHLKPVSGLTEIVRRFGRQPLLVGHANDASTLPTANGLLSRKLTCFRRLVKKRGLRFRDGAFQLLTNLRQCGITIGCVSSSKNGRWVLEETPELRFMFDDFLDGNDGEENGLRWRPETEYFDVCAKNMDCALDRTVVVLDGTDGFSKSCLEKFCLLIDVSADPEEVALEMPRVLVNSFTELSLEVLDEYTARDGVVHHREASAYKRGGNSVTTNSNKVNSASDNVSSHASPNNVITGFPDSPNSHSSPTGTTAASS